jgi:phage tail-like protein
MAASAELGFLHLRQADSWAGFHLRGLKADGPLCLEDTSLETGLFVAGPFEISNRSTRWYRLRVHAEPLPDGGHIQLFTYTSDTDDQDLDVRVEEPFERTGWRALPRDALDALIPNEPARYLWVGGVVGRGDARSPRLSQIRVDYGRDGYLKHLAAVYSRDPARADFLDRHLALDESVLGGLRDEIGDLPQLFDPLAAPGGSFPSWLSWLAGWQTFQLSKLWQEDETRRYLQEAFDLHGKRGTLEGLRRYLKLYAGVEARIEEPALHTHLWTLGETSTLGFTTMLAPAHAQGAVVGSIATLDQSHLIQGDTRGEFLFDDLAHHFCVYVYCAELTRPGAIDDVRVVLDREKPAHTTYELCLIEPRMRVGHQARLGIDTIVADGPPAARLGSPLASGVLAAERQPCPEEDTFHADEEDI